MNLGHPSPDDYIFDVGANKGSMVKLLAGLYPKTRIFAFEPLSIFKIKSAQLNFFNVAVGSNTGVTQFYVCKHNASTSVILPNITSKWATKKAKILGVSPQKLYEETQVPITTIDKVLNENSIKSILSLRLIPRGQN